MTRRVDSYCKGRGMAVLQEPIPNQILRDETTEHLEAKLEEHTDVRP